MVRNFIHKVDNYDDRGSNPNPLYILCNILPIELNSRDRIQQFLISYTENYFDICLRVYIFSINK
jgi:hypothetical protein